MLAEYHYILKEYDKAQEFANEAIKKFEKMPNKVLQLRAHDLVEIIKNSQEKTKK